MDAFFLPSSPGQRFCVLHTPSNGHASAAVVYIHPFAEEMNKARRMAALQSRALAQAGCAVLQIDLHGCGDSSGEFHEASWQGWLDDIVLGARWLQERHGGPLVLWGLRSGALLAKEAATSLGSGQRLLLWQPSPSGKALLQQFLRLRAAADMGQSGNKGIVQQLRADLDAGHHVDVAGYRLPPAVAMGLEQSQLAASSDQLLGVEWLEVSTREGAELLPASASLVDEWRAKGVRVSAEVVNGPAFWQTQEIEDAPALIQSTLAAVTRLALVQLS